MLYHHEWKIRVPWGKLVLLRWGNPKGEPVLLVHGRQDSPAVFIPMLKRLGPHQNYVALDMPGNGLSDPFPRALRMHPRPFPHHYSLGYNVPPVPRQPFVDFCSRQPVFYQRQGRCPWGPKLTRLHFLAAMEFAVQHLGWRRFTFVGHSMGCEQGLFFNVVHPGMISRMLLLDAGPTLMRMQIDDPAEYQRSFYDNYYENYHWENFVRMPRSRNSALASLQRAREVTEAQAEVLLERNFHPIPISEEFSDVSGVQDPTEPLTIMEANAPYDRPINNSSGSEEPTVPVPTMDANAPYDMPKQKSRKAQERTKPMPTVEANAPYDMPKQTPRMAQNTGRRCTSDRLVQADNEICNRGLRGVNHNEAQPTTSAQAMHGGTLRRANHNEPQPSTSTQARRSRKSRRRQPRPEPATTARALAYRMKLMRQQGPEWANHNEPQPSTSAQAMGGRNLRMANHNEPQPSTSAQAMGGPLPRVRQPSPHVPATAAQLMAHHINDMRQRNLEGYLSWDNRLKNLAPPNYGNHFYYELFKNVPPTLLVRASDGAKNIDPKLKEKADNLIKDLNEKLDNFTIADVQGGHDVHFTNPERVVHHILKFLDEKCDNISEILENGEHQRPEKMKSKL